MKAMWPNDQGLKVFIPGLSFNFQIIHFFADFECKAYRTIQSNTCRVVRCSVMWCGNNLSTKDVIHAKHRAWKHCSKLFIDIAYIANS